MKVLSLHTWDLPPKEAVKVQDSLRAKIACRNTFALEKVRAIAGADISYARKNNLLFAVVAVFSYPELKLLEEQSSISEMNYPYIPGLLVLREGPPLLKAFEAIREEPDLIMFDGHGLSHPRGVGIASHLGVLLDKPTIGVAKTVLSGSHEEPALEKGSTSPLFNAGTEVGEAVRTRDRVKPVFVSVGHKIELETAVDFVVKCSRYRLPEPVRYAHMAADRLRSQHDHRACI